MDTQQIRRQLALKYSEILLLTEQEGWEQIAQNHPAINDELFEALRLLDSVWWGVRKLS